MGNLEHCSSTGRNQSPGSHSGGILRGPGKPTAGWKIQRCRLCFHRGVSPVSGAPRTSPWNKWKQFHSADCCCLYSQAWFSATFFLMDCLWAWLQTRTNPPITTRSPPPQQERFRWPQRCFRTRGNVISMKWHVWLLFFCCFWLLLQLLITVTFSSAVVRCSG